MIDSFSVTEEIDNEWFLFGSGVTTVGTTMEADLDRLGADFELMELFLFGLGILYCMYGNSYINSNQC